MSTTEIFSQVRSHLAGQTDSDLLAMVTVSDDQAVTMWIATEIESRHSELTEILEAWADDLDSTESQTDVIVRALS